MSTLRVALFPFVPNRAAFEARAAELLGPDVEIVSGFDAYELESASAGSLPDVFVADACTLGALRSCIETLPAPADLHPAARAAVSSDADVLGLPQLLCPYVLWTADAGLRSAAALGVSALVAAAAAAGTGKVRFPVYDPTDLVALYFCVRNAFRGVADSFTVPSSPEEIDPEVAALLREMVRLSPLRQATDGDGTLAAVAYPDADAALQARHGGAFVAATVDPRAGGATSFFVDVVCVRAGIADAALRARAVAAAELLASPAFLAPLLLGTGLVPARAAVLDALGESASPGVRDLYALDGAAIVPAASEKRSWRVLRHAFLEALLPCVQHPSVAGIRALAVDMVCTANSGHPGMPMGMAPAAYVLWKEFLRADPKAPDWHNRDRWILSNGHGSALQYSMLHLLGYDLSMDDLRHFRQLGSKTPGHPEVYLTEGVECNTGPLGQGIATAVGMACAQKYVGATYNEPASSLSDHRLFVFCGDGCLMEGVGLEAVSLAGHLKLDNLVLIYDDNKITIDGSTDIAFTQNMHDTFIACEWRVEVVDHADWDLSSIAGALERATTAGAVPRPTLVMLRTTIGFGSKMQGTAKVHGSPLAKDDLARFKKLAGLSTGMFEPAKLLLEDFAALTARLSANAAAWRASHEEAYAVAQPEKYARFQRWMARELPADLDALLPKWKYGISPAIATRVASGEVLNALAPVLSNLLGGSADLTPSNNTLPKNVRDFCPADFSGRYLRFGVREHAMLAMGNGMALYGGLVPYVATFLVFVPYGLGAVRAGAIGHSSLLVIGTHDSIFLGEDGPTHQPVESLATLRALPNVLTMRPADPNEVSGCYAVALRNWAQKDPHARRLVVLALSRQNVPTLECSDAASVARGAYVVSEPADGAAAAAVVIATGSEVATAVDAAKLLASKGRAVRVVSAPCLELFAAQDAAYKRSVLPDGVPVVSVEAGTVFGWERYAHVHVGITGYGASAPAEHLAEHYGFTPAHVAAVVSKTVDRFAALSVVPSLVDALEFQNAVAMKH